MCPNNRICFSCIWKLDLQIRLHHSCSDGILILFFPVLQGWYNIVIDTTKITLFELGCNLRSCHYGNLLTFGNFIHNITSLKTNFLYLTEVFYLPSIRWINRAVFDVNGPIMWSKPVYHSCRVILGGKKKNLSFSINAVHFPPFPSISHSSCLHTLIVLAWHKELSLSQQQTDRHTQTHTEHMISCPQNDHWVSQCLHGLIHEILKN